MGENKPATSFANESPRHRIELPAFYLSLFPVTNQQYKLFIRQTGHNPPTTSMFGDVIWKGDRYPEEYADKPVTCVSWLDAWEYCRWARLQLPSEAMWEKGSRGVDGQSYPWGADWDPEKLRWSGYGGGGFGLAAVYEYPASVSPFGLYQTLGNCNEWTNSLFEPYPYDPDDGREQPDAPGYRVLRGGHWDEKDKRVLRCSFRSKALPSACHAGNGFRTALLATNLKLITQPADEPRSSQR